jgi:undecaprenyl-diphosphatase
MNLIYGVVLGIVQGLTEFLPVSSSAHLVIVQHLLPGFEQPGVLFDVILHLGTTAAVLFYFRYEIMRLTMKEIKYLLVGSIPAGVVGIVFQTALEDLFLSTFLVGITLFVTAALNFFTDRASATRERMNYIDAIVMGIGQAIAIIPGISRSGATIFAGTSMGLDRQKAAQYSFLLSVPAILGATVLQLVSHGGEGNLPVGLYVLGFMTALVTGFISIMLTFRFLTEKKFTYFAIYCVVLGVIALLL